MARRRKSRTHAKGASVADSANAAKGNGSPKSFVLHAGEVGSSVKALSRDLRRVLEPNTATRLKERKSNKIKDFLAMAGPLNVTHLLVFAQSAANTNATEDEKEDPTSNVNLRISRTPRGPTLGFKVLRYALVRDILAATKRPRSPGKEFETEPILILNNFSASANANDARQLGLLQTMFQNLFPPIKVHSMPLSAARRVVLLSYSSATRTIDFRHYLITVRPVGVSRSVRKIIDGTRGGQGRASSVFSAAASSDVTGTTNGGSTSFAALRAKGLPNLSSAQDISDYILNHSEMGFLSSASEAESDAESGVESNGEGGATSRQVELSANYVGRGNKKRPLSSASSASTAAGTGEKRAVRLTELGPRMELGLVKIEDGVGDGKGEVLFHEFIHKTPKEINALAKRAKEREKLLKSRRAEQEANVKRKKEEKEALKAEKEAKRKRKEQNDEERAGEDEDEEEEEESSESEDDEFEYEDMFGEKVDGAPNDEEVFEEPEEEPEEEEAGEEDDDSDMSPEPYNESSEGETEPEEEEQRPPPSKKQKSSLKQGTPGKAKSKGVKFSMKAGGKR